jgi:hypothetical protein
MICLSVKNYVNVPVFRVRIRRFFRPPRSVNQKYRTERVDLALTGLKNFSKPGRKRLIICTVCSLSRSVKIIVYHLLNFLLIFSRFHRRILSLFISFVLSSSGNGSVKN